MLARLSNCGELLRAFATASALKSVVCTRVMTSGMVITQRIGQSAAKS
jgi:hypothetical protein